jgi:hypothetical protein
MCVRRRGAGGMPMVRCLDQRKVEVAARLLDLAEFLPWKGNQREIGRKARAKSRTHTETMVLKRLPSWS